MAWHWICLSWDDSGRFISCYFLNSEQNSQVQDFESICPSNLTSSLWRGWCFCHLSARAVMPSCVSLSSWICEPQGESQGLWPPGRGHHLYLIFLPLENFLLPLPWVPLIWKDTCRGCRGHFISWNYYFVLLTGKWHKGLGYSSGFESFFESHTPLRSWWKLCIFSLERIGYAHTHKILVANIGSSRGELLMHGFPKGLWTPV